MLVLICGDRNWTSRAAVEREFNNHGLDPNRDTIMHGAARGADTLAGTVGKQRGFPVKSYPADWDKYGRAAGPIRNKQMLDQNPDLVLAFHPNIALSKGTGNMVKIAREKGTAVEVFEE